MAVAGSQRWGILGIVLVIAIGLAALLPLHLAAARPGARASTDGGRE